jgi:hypothetical protein
MRLIQVNGAHVLDEPMITQAAAEEELRVLLFFRGTSDFPAIPCCT